MPLWPKGCIELPCNDSMGGIKSETKEEEGGDEEEEVENANTSHTNQKQPLDIIHSSIHPPSFSSFPLFFLSSIFLQNVSVLSFFRSLSSS